MLDPVLMLLSTHKGTLEPELVFRGAYYACYSAQSLCDQQQHNPVTHALRNWTTTINKESDGEDFDHAMIQLQELLAADTEFMHSDFFVCTALFAPCLALFITLMSASPRDDSRQSSLLFYQSTELLQAVPEDRKHTVLDDLQHFVSKEGVHFVYK